MNELLRELASRKKRERERERERAGGKEELGKI